VGPSSKRSSSEYSSRIRVGERISKRACPSLTVTGAAAAVVATRTATVIAVAAAATPRPTIRRTSSSPEVAVAPVAGELAGAVQLAVHGEHEDGPVVAERAPQARWRDRGGGPFPPLPSTGLVERDRFVGG